MSAARGMHAVGGEVPARDGSPGPSRARAADAWAAEDVPRGFRRIGPTRHDRRAEDVDRASAAEGGANERV